MVQPGSPSASKRICFINTLFEAYHYYLKAQMAFLHGRGHAITFVSSPDPRTLGPCPDRFRFLALDINRGIDVFAIPGAIWRFYRLFRRERFDLIQYSSPNAAFYASIAGWLAGVPIRVYAQWGIRYVGLRGFSRWIFKLVEWATCRCSTVIQPDSASNLRFAIAEGLYRPGKGRVIWNGSATGVDLTRFDAARKAEWSGEVREQHGIPAQATVLGFVGSLRGDKGIAELYAACQLLFEAWPDLQILLVGDQEGYNTVPVHLRDWARTHPRVHHQPPVLDVEKYFAAMDLFVFPSYREGFGSVVIEAQALGLPVIVTDIAGPTDAMLAGSTGLVVPRADAGAVIEAVGALLGDPARMRAMGAKAREHIRLHFDQKELMPHFARDKEAMMAGPGANR